MTITKRFLTPNEWSRPQKPIKEFKGIVIHWTANPSANAKQNWLYFEAEKLKEDMGKSKDYTTDKKLYTFLFGDFEFRLEELKQPIY